MSESPLARPRPATLRTGRSTRAPILRVCCARRRRLTRPASRAASCRLFLVGAGLQQPHPLFVDWQLDAHGRATTGIAFDLDCAAVFTHDALHDHQSEAAAIFLRRVVRLKNPADLI